MRLYKLKPNEDTFNFTNLEFNDDLKLTEDSKKRVVDFLKELVEVVEFNDHTEFISIISEQLELSETNIGNTLDVYTTNKKIYQLCYLERSEKPLNFLASLMNSKRMILNGDVFIFSNDLITTKMPEKKKDSEGKDIGEINMQEFIKQSDMEFDEIIDIILANYYYSGVCFDSTKYSKYIFDNNMIIKAPNNLKDINLGEFSFKRTDILNMSVDVFYEKEGKNIKEKYNTMLSNFYLETFNNRIFIAVGGSIEKKYESIIDEYINKYITIYNKFCFDDDEIRIPKELKFYDYQTNEKYTNKYIVFDNLYDKIVLSYKK
jgi:hypothetical protein